MSHKDAGIVWDARQGYADELIYRAHIYLDIENINITKKFEAFKDWFHWSSCNLEIDAFQTEIEKLDTLIFATHKDNNIPLNKTEREERREEAYKEMSIIFMKVHRELRERGIYGPIQLKLKPERAFADYND